MEKVCHFCGNTIKDKAVLEILETPIVNLGFSKRVRNALMRAEIDSLEKLLTYTDKDLLRLRNFGKFCLSEINEKIGYMRFAGSTDRACSRQG